ncbi:MAG TPA: hypothetical protein VFM43_05965 [Gaiellaceae bacterium]|nr:hypothetical protein [Gaiellaceae bacterium]
MRETKPVWTSSSFLLYTGGLTVLGGGVAALAYLSGHYGSGGKAGWALLILCVLYAIAHVFRVGGRQIAAGIFAFAAVIAWAVFLVLLFEWWGWHGVNGSLKHWSWSRLALWLLILAAAWDDRRRFGFPFIALISAVVGWVFVVDLITAGGSFTAVVTLLVGIAYFLWGTIRRTPSSFWLHLVGGLLIGGAIVYWAHTGDGEWAGVSIAAFVFVFIAYATKRSSWAVLGTIGFFAATVHYLVGSPTDIASSVTSGSPPPHVSPWAPALAFGLLGFWLVLLGLVGRERRPAPAVPAPE